MDQTQQISKNEQERQNRFKEVKKRRKKKVFIWLGVLVIAAGIVYGLVILSKDAQQNKPGEAITELGQEHIPDGQIVDNYNSNPPTSGPHYAAPADWGAYKQPLPDERLVHNLEHGGIWLSYRDTDDQALISHLEEIVNRYGIKTIVTPRPQNDSRIAVAAWGRLLKLEEFDRGQIENFIEAFINKGPEQTPY